MDEHLNPQGQNKIAYEKYMRLGGTDKCQVTYVWIDGTGQALRSKVRTVDFVPRTAKELPIWNFDGAYTGQAKDITEDDLYLHPMVLYKDPFKLGDNKLVLCEVYTRDGKPHSTNMRRSCEEIMKKAEGSKPWFGMEQEYTILCGGDTHPFGWPKNGYPGPEGPYYCGVGASKVFGRDIVESHYRACLYCDITISGTNAENMPAAWEYQIGPCAGIRAGDDVWMSRYLLDRVAEDFNVVVSLNPKVMPGDWSGAGLHANFSTEAMRQPEGIVEIEKAITKLGKRHKEHIKAYDPLGGKDNERRLTGKHETAHIYNFCAGIANRESSIRIPRQCAHDHKGYLEDRRPASNADPYSVTEIMVRTLCLDEV